MRRLLRSLASLAVLIPGLGLCALAALLLLSPRLQAREAAEAATLPVVTSVADLQQLPPGRRVLVVATLDAGNPGRVFPPGTSWNTPPPDTPYVIYRVSRSEPCGSGSNGVRVTCIRDEPAVVPPVRLALGDGSARIVNGGYSFNWARRTSGREATGGTASGFVAGDRLTVDGVIVQDGGERAIRASHVDGRTRDEYLVELKGDPDAQAFSEFFGVVAA